MTYITSVSIAYCCLIFVLISRVAGQEILKEGSAESSHSRVEQLFRETRAVCVGRYALQVPKHSEVVYGPAAVPYYITRYPGNAGELDRMAQEIASAAIEKKSKFPIGPASRPGSMVGTILQGASSNNRIVYGVDGSTGAFYAIYSLVAVGNDVFVQEQSHYGDANELDKLIDELKSVALRISPRDSDGVPSEAGVCIDGAFVADRGVPHHERLTVGIRMPVFKDIHFTMELTLKDRVIESDDLESQLRLGAERAEKEGNGEWYASVNFLRRGSLQVSNWRGYEALVRRPPQQKLTSVHEFAFVAHGEPGNPWLPLINLDLNTGVKGNTVGLVVPSLNDTEVVELWDRLTQSIRPIVMPPN